MKKSFASDNNSGVHPVIMEAIRQVNHGYVIGYGDDPFTETALAKCRKHFGPESETFFVFTGTAANVLGISAVTRPYHAVLCAESAHLHVHECGGVEKYAGCKVISVPSENGKIYVEQVEAHLAGRGDEHSIQLKVVAISQPTEYGAVYSIEEIKALSSYAHSHDLYLHMDGARLANAAVNLDKSLHQLTGDAGVDILSFGGTKNGMMCGEAVVFLNPWLAKDFKYIRKQGMQLGSKMRFIAAQFNAYLSGNLWYENARHANNMAQYLASRVKNLAGITIPHPVESNAIFPVLPGEAIPLIQKEFFFYIWNEMIHQVRWVTSFDIHKEDVDEFVRVIEKYI
ncbi:MAG: low specificity L-threonine aldolase [Spirochaetales bacterium]|nr:low specificity L-threonine aldolase [Spirochaetales bacterium]